MFGPGPPLSVMAADPFLECQAGWRTEQELTPRLTNPPHVRDLSGFLPLT